MHEVEVKLSTMHLGAQREIEGTELGNIQAVLCECIFTTLMAKYTVFWKISQDS